jgi:hypothetical protein
VKLNPVIGGLLAAAATVVRAADTPPGALSSAVAAYAKAGGESEVPNFRYALVDLDGDSRDDAVVLLTGPAWCGSGGCTMVVFRGVVNGFAPMGRSTVSSEPVRVSPETNGGWRALIVRTRGGDAMMRFEGKRYPLNPSMQPKATPAQLKAATTVIDDR